MKLSKDLKLTLEANRTYLFLVKSVPSFGGSESTGYAGVSCCSM